jgi:hypothetical protein
MVIKAHRLTNIWEKTKGLIGAETAVPIYFDTRWGIHTFGVKFPIDILILNNSNQVVKKAENLKPNRIWLWNPIYKIVLELPAGEIKRLRVKMGDKVL